MPSAKHFFSSRADLRGALEYAEEACHVRYANGMLSSSPPTDFRYSLLDLPSVGDCPNEKPGSGGFFLVFPAKEKIVVSQIQMDDGEICFKVSPRNNPSAIILEPGGVFEEDGSPPSLLVGRLSLTGYGNGGAEMLFKNYSTAFLKEYCRSGGAWWGLEAWSLKENGVQTVW